MNQKIKCSICGGKEGRDRELGYKIGYYKIDLPISGRKISYQTCSKCNRCFIDEEGVTFGNGTKVRKKVWVNESLKSKDE
jgi:hypothetical protein